MKTIGRIFLIVLGIAFSLSPLYAHTAAPSPNALGLSSAEYGNLLAALAQTTPTPPEAISRDATLFSAANPLWPPFPGNVNNLSAWCLGSNIWLLADLDFSYDSTAGTAMASAMGRASPMGDPTGSGGGAGGPLFQFETNGLYLTITNVADGLVYLDLCNATDEVYAIWSTTDLLTGWQVESEVWPTNSAVMPFTIPTADRQSLFLFAEDWTGVTENGNNTPDWWFFQFFGTTALSDTNLDTLGANTLGYDYTNGINPNVIQFTVPGPDNYANTSAATVQLAVTSGVPTKVAVMMDSTNFAAAPWQPYVSSNLLVSAGTNQGWHDLWIGLCGGVPAPSQTWQWTKVKFDWTPPQLVITNPVAATVSQPLIELQGYCPEPLAAFSYDLANAAGLLTNQPILVLDQFFDTNVWEFTTNTFQAYDIPLANGWNTITLHATDLAGNTTNVVLAYRLDHSTKTNPPAINLYWPQNGAQISGSANYTWRGWVADFTATVTASFVDASGNTNIFPGLVERDGNFWIQNLSLPNGTNLIQISVQDAAANVGTTNITVVQSPFNLTIDGFYDALIDTPNLPTTYVWGSIDDTNYTVWVNGDQAQLDGAGGWEATNAPVLDGGTFVIQARAIPNTDNAGNGTSLGTSSPSYANPGNPSSADAMDAEAQEDKPSLVYLAGYYYDYHGGPAMPVTSLSEEWNSVGALVSSMEYDSWWDLFFQYNDSATNYEYQTSLVTDLYDGQGTTSASTAEMTWNWDSDLAYEYGADTHTVTITSGTNISAPFPVAGGPPVLSNHCDEKSYSVEEDNRYDAYGNHYFAKGISQFSRRTQMKYNLFTGGKSIPGEMKVFALFCSLLQDLWTGASDDQINGGAGPWAWYRTFAGIAPQNTDIGGYGSPASDGYIYASMAANQTVDITAKAPGVQYYEGGPGAPPVTLQIFDANTGTNLTGATSTVVVGQQISLVCQVSQPGNRPVTAYLWSVPGFAISNYVVSANASSATVVTNFPTGNTNVVFYWANGANSRTVTCSATVGGQKVVGQTTFNVASPQIYYSVSIQPGAVVNNGSLLTSPSFVFGSFIHSAYNGEAATTQLANGYSTNATIGDNTTNTWELDNYQFYPYNKNGGTLIPVYAGADGNISAPNNFAGIGDGPSLTCNGTTVIHKTYTDYILFQSAGTNSIFVPLGTINWHVYATAIPGTNGYTLTSTNSYADPSVTSSAIFPQWSNTLHNQ